MPNFDNLFVSNRIGRPNATRRAIAAWNRILDKPSVIRVVGSSTDQTVRIEFDNSQARAVKGTAAEADVRSLVIFGVNGHPEVADTELTTGDQIIYNDEEYEIRDVIVTIGELQANGYRVV